jgi:hypothetical protein
MTTSTATEKRLHIEQDETVWLHALLADVQREVAAQPKPQAIERIRARIQEALARPVRRAA